MVTAAETVLEPTERVRAQKKMSEAGLTTLEPAARVRAQKGQYGARSTQAFTERAHSRQNGTGEAHPDGGAHWPTRMFHAPVPMPHVSLEKVTTRDLVFYGGLGALAVAGVLEWPVALAVGGATWLVRSRRKEQG
ncbi:hypothetical protein ACWEQ7_09070 [Streptomyces sp. NPDC004069]|uniref:hypothetical protein n=1 Tax=Streptomyces sp. NPDC052043 TaxID=3365684 RepID=UPI0037D6A947